MSASATAALMLVATLVLTGCGTDEPSAAAPPPSDAPAPSAVPTAVTPTEPEPEVEPDDAQVIAITVVGGEVSGDTGRVEVAMGARVRLTVTADTADEIHVHGFELFEDVSPGQASQLEFVADRPGVFEVELHDSRQVLTRLQIA